VKSFDELVATSTTSDYCIFAYDTPNLGDYIQVLALLQHATPRCFVLRDRPQPHRDLTLLANGWLTHGPFPRCADYRAVHYVGIHLSEEFRTPAVLEELRQCGTIGCRDSLTLEFLRRHGIPAALCRCPTLTFPQYTGERRHVVCVDVDDKVARRAVWKYARGEAIVRLTHVVDWLSPGCLPDGSLIGRLREAYDRLQIYRTAKLVVTTKVHVALPSIAFGTPVIYCGPRDERFGVFDGLDLGGGWERFRWFRMLRAEARRLPRPIACDDAKASYVGFLRSVLAQHRDEAVGVAD
jgi:hypothetical protein